MELHLTATECYLP